MRSALTAGAMYSRTATDRISHLLHHIRGRRGSYTVEAAVTLPLFLIAVLVMSSVILLYACIESSIFTAASEARRASAESIYADTGLLMTHRIKFEIRDSHSQVSSIRAADYGWRTSRWGQDELIILSLDMKLKVNNPIGLRSKASYRLSTVTRAYVGKVRDISNMTADEMAGLDSEPVFIFPKRGERYHAAGCGFLTAASTSGVLSSSIRRQYKPCPLCGSRKASNGTLIYYFPSAGDDYHLRGCPSLQRNYIEIEKRDAVARGYTPCAKCGG